MTEPGTLYGLGIGPGDPELITLKALRILRASPVLAYPAADDQDSLARAIVAEHLPEGQIEIPIRMPMRVERFPAQEVYDWAAEAIGEHLAAGRDVACLCEGDPFFYGSFSFLFERMVKTCRVQVVPGVSSLTGCAAVSGAPLATRDDVLTVIPATLDEAAIIERLNTTDAAAIIKVGRHLDKVRRALDACGLTDKATYVERATMANQRTIPLLEVDAGAAPYFSMILVHRRGAAFA
jgi:precorrin-2/cobalt-factor-2 C20-methyltransferase